MESQCPSLWKLSRQSLYIHTIRFFKVSKKRDKNSYLGTGNIISISVWWENKSPKQYINWGRVNGRRLYCSGFSREPEPDLGFLGLFLFCFVFGLFLFLFCSPDAHLIFITDSAALKLSVRKDHPGCSSRSRIPGSPSGDSPRTSLCFCLGGKSASSSAPRGSWQRASPPLLLCSPVGALLLEPSVAGLDFPLCWSWSPGRRDSLSISCWPGSPAHLTPHSAPGLLAAPDPFLQRQTTT